MRFVALLVLVGCGSAPDQLGSCAFADDIAPCEDYQGSESSAGLAEDDCSSRGGSWQAGGRCDHGSVGGCLLSNEQGYEVIVWFGRAVPTRTNGNQLCKGVFAGQRFVSP
jgi:hypothetical protein